MTKIVFTASYPKIEPYKYRVMNTEKEIIMFSESFKACLTVLQSLKTEGVIQACYDGTQWEDRMEWRLI